MISAVSKILSLLWRGWFVLLAIFLTLTIGVIGVLPFSFRKKDFPKAYFFMRLWSIVVFYGSGLRIKKHNFQTFDEVHPYFVISNHTSMMDIMVMFIINKKPMVFVGKKELSKLPIFGFIFSKNHILVDRKDAKSRKNVFRECANAINEGKSVCIFPEGRVPEEYITLDTFKDGPFALSILTQVPLITFTFCGLKEILPYAYFRGRPGTVTVTLNSIQSTKGMNREDIESLRDKSRNEILETLKIYETIK